MQKSTYPPLRKLVVRPKKWKIMVSNTLKGGQKIEGFFGLFDVLGYSNMIESNNLDTLIEICKETLMDIDDLALSHEGLNKLLLLAPIETKSFAFSDIIVLYQDMPKVPVILQTGTIDVFFTIACYLLRLAFDKGIPIRGAVSYGEYYIREDKGCFIGYPIIEALMRNQSKTGLGQFSVNLPGIN